MTAQTPARKTDAQPYPSVVVKHFRSDSDPVATCDRCDWRQPWGSLAEMRIHVRHHPTHTVTRSEIRVIRVWAQTRDGNAWAELFSD